MTADPAPGARIELEGALNLRDIGGWATPDGPVRRGRAFRCDRLSTLTEADLAALDGLGIDTVIDLRHDGEVSADPSRLWPAVRAHHEIPMGGRLANQRSFIERVFDGELDEITDADVAESYTAMLADHGPELGRAVEALLGAEAALYHCTAGKDRTGLLTMLMLWTVGVARHDIVADFALSNIYRAEVRVEQLRPQFVNAGLDIERFRPALSAPRPALEEAMRWIDDEYGSAERYLGEAGGVDQPAARLRRILLG